MSTQVEKHASFAALHEGPAPFVIANAWDAGSARILSALGFDALATTSAGYAISRGKRDSFAALSQAEVLENAREIVEATALPVSADLEDGFGAAPETCADTIQKAIAPDLSGAVSRTPRAIRTTRSTISQPRLSGSPPRQMPRGGGLLY